MTTPRPGRKVVRVLGLTAAVVWAGWAATATFGKNDPAKVIGAFSDAKVEGKAAGCVHCHANEVKVWQTGQAANGKAHRNAGAHLSSDKGKAYIAKVGSADVCAQCHTTGNVQHEGKPIGVSCESCHGAAKDWIKPHCSITTFGDLEGNKGLLESESKEDRQKRVEECATFGMVRSDDLYGLASNCLGCHIVAEPAVLAAGHAAKSDGFELLKWSQGHVRHNFLWGKSNPMPDDNRKRMLFVAGKLAEYEHASAVPALKAQAGDVMKALKGLAKANAPVEGGKPKYDKRWIALIKGARKGMTEYKAAAQKIVEGMLDGTLPIDKGIKLPTEYK